MLLYLSLKFCLMLVIADYPCETDADLPDMISYERNVLNCIAQRKHITT